MPLADRIRIENWHVNCRVGHTAAERAFPQIIVVSVDIFTPLARAGTSDRLPHTVDYDAVLRRLRARITARPYNLLEAVAADISDVALASRGVNAVRVHVTKKIYPDVDAVGVEIHREKKPAR
jgi:FolB domain-containing protein